MEDREGNAGVASRLVAGAGRCLGDATRFHTRVSVLGVTAGDEITMEV